MEPESNKPSNNKISEETTQLVKEFHVRDDVSRQTPGLKDYVTVWGDKGKEQLQKRHLLFNICERRMFCGIVSRG